MVGLDGEFYDHLNSFLGSWRLLLYLSLMILNCESFSIRNIPAAVLFIGLVYFLCCFSDGFMIDLNRGEKQQQQQLLSDLGSDSCCFDDILTYLCTILEYRECQFSEEICLHMRVLINVAVSDVV